MKGIEALSRVLGYPLASAPTSEALAAFHARGIDVSSSTLSRVRRNVKTGALTIKRLEGIGVIEHEDAGKKDDFYYRIADVGQLMRRPWDSNPRRYVTIGLTEAIGQGLGVDVKSVQRSLRAMRADLVFGLMESSDQDVVRELGVQAALFIDAYTSGRNRSAGASQLNQQWDGMSPEGFYRVCYDVLGKGIDGWAPYEFEVFKTFYRKRKKEGSPLSVLDKIVLCGLTNRIPWSTITSAVREQSGVPVDYTVLYNHTNTLLFGIPAVNGRRNNEH